MQISNYLPRTGFHNDCRIPIRTDKPMEQFAMALSLLLCRNIIRANELELLLKSQLQRFRRRHKSRRMGEEEVGERERAAMNDGSTKPPIRCDLFICLGCSVLASSCRLDPDLVSKPTSNSCRWLAILNWKSATWNLQSSI